MSLALGIRGGTTDLTCLIDRIFAGVHRQQNDRGEAPIWAALGARKLKTQGQQPALCLCDHSGTAKLEMEFHGGLGFQDRLANGLNRFVRLGGKRKEKKRARQREHRLDNGFNFHKPRKLRESDTLVNKKTRY